MPAESSPNTGSDKVESDRESESLDARKSAILRAVVAEHIETGQPVGSQHVAGGLGVSSATVRNEMSTLEREGFLTHPHTSAGRIPTDQGYRFFVDSLKGTGRLVPGKVVQVKEFFDQAHGELEQMLTDTSRMLSKLTDYAAVIVGPAAENAEVRAVQVVGLGPSTHGQSQNPSPHSQGPSVALVVAVLSNGAIEKHTIELPEGTGEQHLGAATAHLSRALVGRPIDAATRDSMLRTGDPRTDGVCDRAIASLIEPGDERDGGDVFVGGAARMASAFEAVETIRNVLDVLERQYVVVSLLRDALDRSSKVSIGTEHGNEEALRPLTACSVVVAPYHVDGRHAGTIGVLGPTRMNYPEAMAAVAAVSDRLSHRLSEG